MTDPFAITGWDGNDLEVDLGARKQRAAAIRLADKAFADDADLHRVVVTTATGEQVHELVRQAAAKRARRPRCPGGGQQIDAQQVGTDGRAACPVCGARRRADTATRASGERIVRVPRHGRSVDVERFLALADEAQA